MTALAIVNTAVSAPMPIASDSTIAAVVSGLRTIERHA
jgi:hypothetical protein